MFIDGNYCLLFTAPEGSCKIHAPISFARNAAKRGPNIEAVPIFCLHVTRASWVPQLRPPTNQAPTLTFSFLYRLHQIYLKLQMGFTRCQYPRKSHTQYTYLIHTIEVFTAVTMKNGVFWGINTQFVIYRRHIMSPL
jgi:hypothetical protein